MRRNQVASYIEIWHANTLYSSTESSVFTFLCPLRPNVFVLEALEKRSIHSPFRHHENLNTESALSISPTSSILYSRPPPYTVNSRPFTTVIVAKITSGALADGFSYDTSRCGKRHCERA
jgi:hypothetical protein